MKPASYIEDVESARLGDREAFGRLVARFEKTAVGVAMGWLTDLDLAREAAQDAFIDAYCHLEQLENPAAFPGWLRRIVRKHCDRTTRRVRPVEQELDPERVPATGVVPPETQIETDRERAGLRAAISSLPPAERLPVALYYLGDVDQPDVASFLELPLSTVKKRLRVARERLRERGREEMQTLNMESSSESIESFSDHVRFFLAVRAGDLAAVEGFLAVQPSLVESEQNWDFEHTRRGQLPLANRATPLIVAIERNDPAMVELLLRHGASAEGACGCETNERPLWTAVVFRRLELARRLLAAGASSDATSITGTTALHAAAMRGYPELVDALLEAGAARDVRDVHGRTALDWATLKGHHEVIGRLDPGGDAQGSASSTSELSEGDVFHSGIRALDFFAPLELGALVRIPYVPAAGLVVFLFELTQRFLQRDDSVVIWTGFGSEVLDARDLESELVEAGLGDRVGLRMAPVAASFEDRREAFEAGVREAELAGAAGRRALLVVFSSLRDQAEVEATLHRLEEQGERGLTSVVVTASNTAAPEVWSTLRRPFAAQVAFDPARVRGFLFPAIDPLHSFSRPPRNASVDDEHELLAADVRDALSRYQEIDPEFSLPDPATLAGEEQSVARVGQALLRFFIQPFQTTEPFTAVPGNSTPREELLAEVRRLMVAQAD